MVFIRKTKIGGHTYLYLVTNKWVRGKVKQKFLAYLGREEKLPNILNEYVSLKKLTKGDLENLSYSAPLSLWKIAEELELERIFSNHFKKKWGVDASIASILMIVNYALDRKTKNKLHEWYEQTYLKHITKIPAKKLNSDLLYRTLDFFTEEKIELLHKQIFQKAKEKFNLSDNISFYDVTAILFEGKKCPLAKRGYNPEAAYKLQANLGLAVTTEKFPVVHKTFDGSVKDVSTFDKALNLLDKTIDLKKTIFIFDRGLSSKDNRDKIKAKESKFIGGLSKNNTIKKLILSIKEDDFTKINNNDLFYEFSGNERKIIFFNKEIAKEQGKLREKNLKKIEAKLKKIKPERYAKERLCEKIGEVTRKYKKFFKINYNKFGFERKEKEIEKAKQLDGKSAIITNTDYSAKEILGHYREKNLVEMSFKDLKLFIDIRPVWHHKDRRVLAHIFLAVLALGLRSLFELKLRREKLEMTSHEALNKLSKVRALCCNGNILRLTGEDEETKKIAKITGLES